MASSVSAAARRSETSAERSVSVAACHAALKIARSMKSTYSLRPVISHIMAQAPVCIIAGTPCEAENKSSPPPTQLP